MNGLPDNIPDLLELIRRAYTYRINDCGPVANGVFWKDADGQVLRLEILLQGIEPKDLKGGITINDFGCGYGTLFDLVAEEPMMDGGAYFGYDIVEDMINTAQKRHPDPRANFFVTPVATERADYSFVSGTYNMSLGAHRALWTHYVKTSLKMLWEKTDKVLAFNMLDNNSAERLGDLYYADKREMVAYALTLSPEVDIIDDYPLNEFTIFIKRVGA